MHYSEKQKLLIWQLLSYLTEVEVTLLLCRNLVNTPYNKYIYGWINQYSKYLDFDC